MAAKSARSFGAVRLAAARVVSFLAVLALAFFASAAGASAAVPVVVVAAVPLADPIAPDPKNIVVNAKQYMLNVTGKVLGKAMPSTWKRQQIALNNRYNFGWDELSRVTGIKSDAPAGQLITQDWSKTPQTKADYDLRRMEQGLKGGTGNKPFKVPATPMSKFVKGVGGAATAYMGFEFGAMIGNAVPAGWLGISDKQGVVCSQTGDDFLGNMVQSVTGTNCSAWGMDPSYTPNQDAPASYSWSNVCNDKTPQTCMTINAYQAYRYTNYQLNGSGAMYCMTLTGPAVSVSYYRLAAGNITADNGRVGTVNANSYAVATASGSIQCPAGSAQFLDDAYTTPSNKFRTTAVYPAFPDQMPPIEGIALQKQNNTWTSQSTRTATASDPDRTLECSIVGSDGATYRASSLPFKESTKTMATPVCPSLPDGVVAQNVAVDQKADAGKGVPAANLVNQPTTQEYKDWATNYPECTTGACKLDLMTKINPNFPTSCFESPDQCRDWFTQSDKSTVYECRYGTHPVALEECNVYSGVFKKERIAVGAPYSDPLSGEWDGSQSAPSPDKQAMGQAIQNPVVVRGCDGMNVTGFDPVGFVMRPIQCAFEWAFIPRALPVQASFVGANDTWKGTAPGSVITAVGGWHIAGAPSGCSGVSVHMYGKDAQMMDACPGTTLAPIAAATNTISAGVFIVGGILTICAIVASVIGYRGMTVGGGNH